MGSRVDSNQGDKRWRRTLPRCLHAEREGAARCCLGEVGESLIPFSLLLQHRPACRWVPPSRHSMSPPHGAEPPASSCSRWRGINQISWKLLVRRVGLSNGKNQNLQKRDSGLIVFLTAVQDESPQTETASRVCGEQNGTGVSSSLFHSRLESTLTSYQVMCGSVGLVEAAQ